MLMVADLPPQVAKPKPNRALAPHTRGEYIEYASSEMLGLHGSESQLRHRQFRYEGNHRHGRRCECEDCQLVRWLNLIARVRKYERHGQIPPRLTDDPNDPRYNPVQSEINERTRPAIARRQAVRARRYFHGDLPAWLYCVLAGLPNPRDELAMEVFERDEPPTMSAHAEMMEIARVSGRVFYESEGYIGGEVWPPTGYNLPGETGEPWEVRRQREILQQAENQDDDSANPTAG